MKTPYNWKWHRASEAWARRNPYCVLCDLLGRVEPWGATDHRIPHNGTQADPLFWDHTNWQSLCRSCHAHKSSRESRGLVETWTATPGRYVLTGEPPAGLWLAANGLLHGNTEDVFDRDEIARRIGFDMHPWPAMITQRVDAIQQQHGPDVVLTRDVPDGFNVAKQLEARLIHVW